VTSDQVDQVERALGITLPGEYRALVLAYPTGLGPGGPDYELLDDPAQLIAINRQLREQGFFGLPWPAHFFSFGGDGSGNEYYLDLLVESSPVYFADHEGTVYNEQWPSLQAWLAERLEEQAEWEEEERQRAARRATRRWWEFWI
jgi:hypothetical protein